MNAEKDRLEEDRDKKKHWRRWGHYLSEREWATVREDYSENNDTWNYFSHDAARSRAYRWGEDGIAGISDNHQHLCFALAFWNGKDPILKERLFGLSGPEGNHGEDVKEAYFYLDNTPTHSYMKYLYKYPHEEFPYKKLVEENQKRNTHDLEYELVDTGVFDQNNYFDIEIEYAKLDPDDIFIRITVNNRGQKTQHLHVIPQLWYRNTWSWQKKGPKPLLFLSEGKVISEEHKLGKRILYFQEGAELLFTENETNFKRLYNTPNASSYVKDAFHRYLIQGEKTAINPECKGTKMGLHYQMEIPAGGQQVIKCRLTGQDSLHSPLSEIDAIFVKRKEEADQFYKELNHPELPQELGQIQRQAFAGLLWNKQFYHFVVEDWLKQNKTTKRNLDWEHFYNEDIFSMPDKWEYPYFCSWDSAFHTLPLAMIDPEFAKRQLVLLTREWNMHPNGQVPAYEWSFKDVNPPVHAWAAWRVYKIEQRMHQNQDTLFLERVFQKLLLNFTWWVNRKDVEGRNIFQGGFLGLDNISVFNRSEDLPFKAQLFQSDATSWMGMYSLNLLTIALELAKTNPSYEDMASKFFEHFLYISEAINVAKDHGFSLWNEEDGFYYDLVLLADGTQVPLKVRSLVGLIPLFAVTTLESELMDRFPEFSKRMHWFLNNRLHLCKNLADMEAPGEQHRHLLAIVNPERLKRVLAKMLDEKEFLSPYGIRSLSKYHEAHPYHLNLGDQYYEIKYEPGESSLRLFGGNSNWRGPIWFPLNMLIIESLQKFYHYFGDTFQVECPTGSGHMMNLWDVSKEISQRLSCLFLKDKEGNRPLFGGNTKFQQDPYWKDHLLFYEYFNAENGAGLGASHQTGWTGLIAKLIQQLCRF